MKIVCEFKYAVIQFLEQPCSSIDEYICIPQSWIRVRRVTDRKSLVAYPSESPSLIEKRVKRAEMVSEKWSLYMAIVKHETNSYEDAYNYIMARRYDSTTDNGCSRTITAEHELLPATTPEINSSSRKRIKQSNNRQKRLKVVDDAKLTSHSSPSPAMVARNTLHAALDPLILAKQISQGVYLPQGNQQASTYQDHLQRIVLNHEIHRRTISNLQTLLPDFLTNQKVSQGSRQSTPYTAQIPTKNVANQFSQIQNSSSVHKDHSQVLHTQEIPASKSSNVNCTNYVPSSYSGTMYVPSTPVSTSNSEGQSTFHTQYLDVNQRPVDGSHSHQDPSVQEMIVDGSTEVNYSEQSVSSEQCTENESSAIQNSQNNSIECSIKKSPPVDKVTKDDRSSTQDVDKVNEQISTEMSTEEILTNQIPFDQEGLSVDSIKNIEDLWLDRMADLFERMNSDFLNTCKMAHEMHESLVQSAKTFECIASVSANLRKLKKSKATAEKPKDVTVESKKVAEKEQVEKEKEKSDVDMAEKGDNEAKKSDDNKKVAEKKHVEMKEKEKSDVEMAENRDEPKNGDDNDESSNDDKNTDQDKDKNKDDAEIKDNDEDKGEETPKKIRGCIRAFVLPPEYDPNDTKWTLKYRKPDSKIKKLGLVELVEKSRVYINAIKLAHCKRVSKDSQTLARMLLVEVFSQKALSVCSLTGARANAFDMKGENVRPGLDEHARMVILSFVEEHARHKGWGPFDTQSVINSIRSKIQEIRAKYSQNPTET